MVRFVIFDVHKYTSKLICHASDRQEAQVCCTDWNTLHTLLGSLADEHSTL
jgi:hypothetical protein